MQKRKYVRKEQPLTPVTADELMAENARRKEVIFHEYDPVTGKGCNDMDDRVEVCIEDFFIPKMYMPKTCMNTVLMRALAQNDFSISSFIINYLHREYNEQIKTLVSFEICRIRFAEDPEFAFYLTDRIEDKVTGQLIPFRLNYAQRYVLHEYECMRKRGEPIYAIILKARQWGGSTLTQMYIKWMQDFRHPNGWNAIILAQVKATSKKIKAMYRKAIEQQAGWTVGLPGINLRMTPFESSQDDFVVSNGYSAIRTSTISIASFDNFDNVRGSNFHCAHYSEVAYWKETPEHDPEAVLSSISGSIRRQADNVEVFESTGRGASGFFYDMCQRAKDEKNHDAYKFIFIPFYYIENDMMPFKSKDEEKEFAQWLIDARTCDHRMAGYRESGKFFWRIWQQGATFEAINWYREERNKYTTHAYMATEAPIDDTEAFRHTGNLVFNPYSIDAMQELFMKEPAGYVSIMLYDKQKERNFYTYFNASFPDAAPESAEMKVWEFPNNKILRIKNRYVVAVDIGGRGDTSDYTVMTVIDRKGLCPGEYGMPRVVARWRGHVRHDILAWKAAALAQWYSHALLVIESNSADKERTSNTEGDHFGTIIEEIAKFYSNVYQRKSSAENTREKTLPKYGFQTNKLTKGWVIDDLIAAVEDKLWEEPDKDMYAELRAYERKDDNTLGNVSGRNMHDDVLMSTGIGLWVSANDMPQPFFMKPNHTRRTRNGYRYFSRGGDVTEATI